MFALRSPLSRHFMDNWANTTAQPTFNLKDVANLPIPLPPNAEQQAIACILGALDDKIELNRRRNRTLEAMARAIFQSWFVDFDPVKAKAAGRTPPGLSPALAALFPDSFTDSPLGPIPTGWRVGTVKDVCEFAYGKALKAEQRQPGDVPVMGSNGQVGVHNEALAKGPGIVVGRKGNPGIVTWVNTDFFPIDTTFYVVPTSSDFPLTFLAHALDTLNLASLGADSAVPGLNRNIAYGTQLCIPAEQILSAFAKQASGIRNRMEASEKETRTLAALRDALLPKLISGQLRVPDAERIVGRAV
jgi:type I restriction enzyme S subunit